MADPKGQHLFVNLSAAQSRKRLKGFGHGVRKIQSAGKNRSLIIHTATGTHLQDLQHQFADVGFAGSESDLSEPISNLKNLGATSTQWLHAIGIRTIDDLRGQGPILAYLRVKQLYGAANLNLLWALAAGLEDRDWRELTAAEKEALVSQLP